MTNALHLVPAVRTLLAYPPLRPNTVGRVHIVEISGGAHEDQTHRDRGDRPLAGRGAWPDENSHSCFEGRIARDVHRRRHDDADDHDDAIIVDDDRLRVDVDSIVDDYDARAVSFEDE